jgi:hypothetical protein
VGGTGFPEYARLIRDGLAVLQPQAVFLVVFANDLPTAPLPEEAKAAPPAFHRCSSALPRLLEVVHRLEYGQVVPSVFHRGPYPFHEPVPAPNNPFTSDRVQPPENLDPQILDAMRRGKVNPWLLRAWEGFEAALTHDFSQGGGADEYLYYSATLCWQCHARLIVVYVPYHAVVNPIYFAAIRKLGGSRLDTLSEVNHPRYRRQQIHLQQVTRRLNIPFLDTTEEMIHAEKTRGLMYWPIDCHCTAAGYRLVAEICARHWRDGTLPRLQSNEQTASLR